MHYDNDEAYALIEVHLWSFVISGY